MTPNPGGSRSRRGKSGHPNPIDVHVGARVRLRRTLLGMSQEKLGHAIGLTFQQVQKYERGTNRIGASRLHELAQVLDVPVAFFFEDLNLPDGTPIGADGAVKPPKGLSEPADVFYGNEPIMRRETLELVRAYLRITDPQLRRRVFELAKAIANAYTPAAPRSR
ncbi:MAG: helix-turn-helix domain-containing protein [Alphaproteobacteria bacterium]|nr:helix-turn-helix domain-containing protein [Alphaproteobacteria bacterium]